MSSKVADNIIKARTNRGLTQEQVANLLGISRATYLNIETGKSKPNVSLLEKLANKLNVPVAEFFDEPRNNDKFEQMYFYILGHFKNGIPKTKLAKLLYLADFSNFYDLLESMSGVRYVRREYGPVADIFFETTEKLFDNGKINIKPLDRALMISSITYKPNNNLLNDTEKKRLDEICELWKDKDTQEIVNYTHGQKPWKACLDGEYIPYSLITQEDPDHVYTPVA
ncbi:MAG: hypothetical protein PWQ10_535 [Patescibacteria group bacterium]|nr:hypothetical protein [Patescibacteria group bacterium]